MAQFPESTGWKLPSGNVRMMVKRERPSIRTFLLSQASDPVLAAACEPAQSKFGTPLQPLKKRRR